jgi:hypothetical protein
LKSAVQFRCEPTASSTLLLNLLLNRFPLRRQPFDQLIAELRRLDAAERRIWFRVHRETFERDRQRRARRGRKS